MRIEITPSENKPGVASVFVELPNVTNEQYANIVAYYRTQINEQESISDAVASAFVYATRLCPLENPSDVWQHIIYRYLVCENGHSDQQWKRISGFALERALVTIYNPRFQAQGYRFRKLDKEEAKRILTELGIQDKIKLDKIDCIVEKNMGTYYQIVAGVHVKASLAERIQDDVPASLALMEHGLKSIVLTMDSKSFPPPHGDGINHGELGGRSWDGPEKARIKRQYVENDGQFDALISYNSRTPPSAEVTPSGKKIHTLGLNEEQPDMFVKIVVERIRTE